MLKIKHQLGIILFVALSACSQAPTLPVANQSDLEMQAIALLHASYPAEGSGAVAIITKGNETLFVAGHGLADISAGKQITEDTVFRLGSITKQFAAASMMLLVEEGLIDLDEPLKTYLPDYPEPGASIDVRHLLNHTSGIPSYTGIPGWMVETNTARAYTTEEMIDVFKGLPVEFQPGEKFNYNNSGYVLVGAVIEAVTGKSWDVFLQERITGPLDIKTIQSGTYEADVALMATGYTADEDVSQSIHMSVPHAAGALIGDVQDLADWGNAFHDGKVVKPKSYEEMTTVTLVADGEEIPYGYGLGFGEVGGQPIIGHGGGIFGFATDSIYIPSKDVFVAVMANSDNPAISPGILARKLAALAIGQAFPEFTKDDFNVAALEPVLGVYESDEVTRTLFISDGKLYTYLKDGNEVQAFPAGDNTFFYGPNSLYWFEIDKDENGNSRMLFHANGAPEPDVLIWTGSVPEIESVAIEILENYVGTYELSIPMAAKISPAEGGLGNGLTIQLTGQPPFPMVAENASEFSVRSVGAVIRFQTNAEGNMAFELVQNGQTITGKQTAE